MQEVFIGLSHVLSESIPPIVSESSYDSGRR